MKQIDRYILGTFLRNYVASLFVLVGLYVMMDAFFNLDEITRGRSSDMSVAEALWGIFVYYFAQSLFIYGQLAGVITVVAAAFTLMRMSRFNELTALLAAGVPLIRVAMPVVAASAAINLVIQPINQELLVPRLAGYLTLERWEAASGERDGFTVEPMPTGDGGVFMASKFEPASPSQPIAVARDITVIERNGIGGLGLLTADEATFDVDRDVWILTGGRRLTNLLEGSGSASIVPPESVADEVWETVLTPKDVELARASDLSVGVGGSFYDLLSTATIHESLSRAGERGGASADLVRAKHARLSGHVMNLVLILLAVPAVLTRQPGELKKAAGRTILLIGGAMTTVFLSQMLAREPPAEMSLQWATRWPALLSWMPIFLFGPLAVVLIDRMKS